ncbi:hypothetical protein NLI96_g6491 [Meripilus lineatus]|uniref:CCHC-type domain-containing protein n=1 Tax=Meripilus lineatus TaxID=2056292 RepID=A0AAD5V660_9APHY|nr:hypothetical protein NLI96_g6491 [Physisporinus lineatus]
MGENASTSRGDPELPVDSQTPPEEVPCYFVDDEATYGQVPLYYCEYSLQSEIIIGEETPLEAPKQAARSSCFNCGSLDHICSNCPEVPDRAVIALSRQMYMFYKEDNLDYRRFFEVEISRQQRLRWLDSFCPGEIRGELLRDALGLRGNDVGEHVQWLRHIADWGYPKGWASPVDPKLQMLSRIWGSSFDTDTVDDIFVVVDAEDRPLVEKTFPSNIELRHTSDEQTQGDVSTPQKPDSTSSGSSPDECPTLRWAKYPDYYFSSELLPVYNGIRLPKVGAVSLSVDVSSTFTPERQALWDKLKAQRLSGRRITDIGNSLLPPPPPTTPPPLPPSNTKPPPPLSAPPPLPPNEQDSHLRHARNSCVPPPNDDHSPDSEESDMDLSD